MRNLHGAPQGLAPRHLSFSLLLALLVAPLSAAGAQELSGSNERLGKQILSLTEKDGARQAHWGVYVVSLKDGKELVGWNHDKLFVPASTAKLFVMAAALTRLGPDFRYQTTVEAATPIGPDGILAGDLILVGRGDPNLSGRTLPYQNRTERVDSPTRHFEEMATDLVAQGLRAVQGNLVVDDGYFVSEPFLSGWEVDDLMWNYGAPVSALTINDNVLFLTIKPGPAPGAPAAITLEPNVSYYEIDNRLMTVARARSVPGGGVTGGMRSLSMDRRPGSTVLRIWGQVPEGDPGWGRGLAIEDPPRFAGEFFRQELIRRGVDVRGSVQVRRLERSEVADLMGSPRRPTPYRAAAHTLVAHQSLPLVDSLKVIGKVSQNLHAEMLLRTLGRERRGVGSTEAGLEEVKAFLTELGIHEDAVSLRDASGLSRQNLATPKALATLLQRMDQSEYGSLWRGLLPVAGEDGTLAERLRGPATWRRVWAKTGSLTGVAALAGYALNQENEMLAFVIFANQYNPARNDITRTLDSIADLIARSR